MAAEGTGYDKERGGHAEPFELRSHDGGIAPFPVVEGQQTKRLLVAGVDAVLQVAQVNKVERTAEHLDVAAGLLKTQNVFIDNHTTGLEQTNKQIGRASCRERDVLSVGIRIVNTKG